MISVEVDWNYKVTAIHNQNKNYWKSSVALLLSRAQKSQMTSLQSSKKYTEVIFPTYHFWMDLEDLLIFPKNRQS